MFIAALLNAIGSIPIPQRNCKSTREDKKMIRRINHKITEENEKIIHDITRQLHEQNLEFMLQVHSHTDSIHVVMMSQDTMDKAIQLMLREVFQKLDHPGIAAKNVIKMLQEKYVPAEEWVDPDVEDVRGLIEKKGYTIQRYYRIKKKGEKVINQLMTGAELLDWVMKNYNDKG